MDSGSFWSSYSWLCALRAPARGTHLHRQRLPCLAFTFAMYCCPSFMPYFLWLSLVYCSFLHILLYVFSFCLFHLPLVCLFLLYAASAWPAAFSFCLLFFSIACLCSSYLPACCRKWRRRPFSDTINAASCATPFYRIMPDNAALGGLPTRASSSEPLAPCLRVPCSARIPYCAAMILSSACYLPRPPIFRFVFLLFVYSFIGLSGSCMIRRLNAMTVAPFFDHDAASSQRTLVVRGDAWGNGSRWRRQKEPSTTCDLARCRYRRACAQAI